jgi:hypothetical protein
MKVINSSMGYDHFRTWLETACDVVDEMYGNHSHFYDGHGIDETGRKTISELGFELRAGHILVEALWLKTDWYSYYRVVSISADNFQHVEICYDFVDELDAIRFKLSLT